LTAAFSAFSFPFFFFFFFAWIFKPYCNLFIQKISNAIFISLGRTSCSCSKSSNFDFKYMK
jgi:hypothetical protein